MLEWMLFIIIEEKISKILIVKSKFWGEDVFGILAYTYFTNSALGFALKVCWLSVLIELIFIFS